MQNYVWLCKKKISFLIRANTNYSRSSQSNITVRQSVFALSVLLTNQSLHHHHYRQHLPPCPERRPNTVLIINTFPWYQFRAAGVGVFIGVDGAEKNLHWSEGFSIITSLRDSLSGANLCNCQGQRSGGVQWSYDWKTGRRRAKVYGKCNNSEDTVFGHWVSV